MDTATTKQSMGYSNDCMPSSQVVQFNIPFTQHMSAVNITQQIPPHEASTPHSTYSSLLCDSLQNLIGFLMDSQSPYSMTEQHLCREGHYPEATVKRIDDSNKWDRDCLQQGFSDIQQHTIDQHHKHHSFTFQI